MMNVLRIFFRVSFSPLGWLWIYKVYCSQFKVCKDSLLLDEILLAFIEIDIEGKRLPKIIPFPIRWDLTYRINGY